MNKAKLTRFANWLANSRHKFLMRSSCRCIAGQAAHFFDGKYGKREDACRRTLIEAFGLDEWVARGVFIGYGVGIDDYYKMKQVRQIAVEVLRHLVKTGEVDWPRAERKVTGASRY